MVPFSFAGETFAASTEGALHWPAQQALLVADLHLEKASWFARLGQFLPPYDSDATLTALKARGRSDGRPKALLPRRQFPRPLRLRPVARASQRAASRNDGQARMDLDPRQPRPGLRRSLRRAPWSRKRRSAGIVLRHEADRDDPRPEISGHFHPKYRVNVRGRHVSRRCFVASSTQAHPAGVRLAHRRARRLAPGNRQAGRTGGGRPRPSCPTGCFASRSPPDEAVTKTV